MRYIPVSSPMLIGNETKYVLDCLESNWISSKGQYIDQLEKSIAEYTSSEYALTAA